MVETGHVGDYGTIQDGLNGLVWDIYRRTSTRTVCEWLDLKKLFPIELGSPAGRPIRQLRRGQRVGFFVAAGGFIDILGLSDLLSLG